MKAVTQAIDRSHSAEELARVAAYLECLGLPAAYAELQARDLFRRHDGEWGAVGEAVVNSAVAVVMSEYETWLDWLCDAQEEVGGCCGALLAWHLRPVLAAHPEAFLRQDEISEPVRRAVRAARQCPFPEPTPMAMPTQSFGELPPVFRAGFWRGVVRRIAAMVGGELPAIVEKGEPPCRDAADD
jgi:hypothetical protein